MDFLTVDKLILVAIFFIPGFIFMKAFRLFIADTKTDFSKDLYEALGLSFINAIIFSYPLYLISGKTFIINHELLYWIVISFVILIAPLVWAYLYYKISSTKWFSSRMIDPNKSTWDKLFSLRKSYWVIVNLKNGKKIAGKFGMNSYSSAYPLPEEIYIEDLWDFNDVDGFIKTIPRNMGILITSNEISTIQFIN